MAWHNELGHHGENVAASYLEGLGYHILERNWHAPHTRNEVDIIAYGEDHVVFVEVKTRRDDHFGLPHEAVNRRKQSAIMNAANAYVIAKEIDYPLRFDIISVIGETVDHIKGAFLPRARYY